MNVCSDPQPPNLGGQNNKKIWEEHLNIVRLQS